MDKPSKSDSSTSSEELDVESEKFNPIKALTSDKFKLPVELHPADNLAILESRIKKVEGNLEADLTECTVKKKPVVKMPVVDENKFHVTKLGRVFPKEQAPVTLPKPTRRTRNVLTRMEKARGPLELLKTYKKKKIRIKVYTRKQNGIRGFVTGTLQCFDKHFNLVLTDCHEQWTRKKYSFSDNPAVYGQSRDCSDLLQKMGIEIPETSVKSLNRKYVELSRQIPQLFVKGEQVVLVTTEVPRKTESNSRGAKR